MFRTQLSPAKRDTSSLLFYLSLYLPCIGIQLENWTQKLPHIFLEVEGILYSIYSI